MYQLDVYAAITWNGIVRHRESQSTVLYAAEVDDDEITEAGIQPRPHRQQPWLRGWNFVVDLYRILEHAVESLRARKLLSPDDPSEPVSSLFERKTGPSGSEVMNVVGKLYDQLSPDFKGAKAMTGNLDEDVYGFQGGSSACFTYGFGALTGSGKHHSDITNGQDGHGRNRKLECIAKVHDSR